jgi:signal peptidase I
MLPPEQMNALRKIESCHKKSYACFRSYLKNNRVFFIALSMLLGYLSIVGMAWLSFVIMLFLSLFFAFRAVWKYRKNRLISLLTCLAGVFISAIVIRVFVLEIYNVPSISMEDTLFANDKIIVNKLSYGPNLPASPYDIPWIDLFVSFLKKNDQGEALPWPGYRTLPGLSAIKAGDVIVFRRKDDMLVKRCIGLPGTLIRITDGDVLINEKMLSNGPAVKFAYKVYFRRRVFFTAAAKRLHVGYTEEGVATRDATVLLCGEQLRRLKGENGIDSIVRQIDRQKSFPWDQRFDWSADNMGPVTVPFRGFKIPLNTSTVILYGDILNEREGLGLYEVNGKYYVRGKECLNYVFKENYYFMMGDNRTQSNDSRFWGFVNEQDIEGRAVLAIAGKRIALKVL